MKTAQVGFGPALSPWFRDDGPVAFLRDRELGQNWSGWFRTLRREVRLGEVLGGLAARDDRDGASELEYLARSGILPYLIDETRLGKFGHTCKKKK